MSPQVQWFSAAIVHRTSQWVEQTIKNVNPCFYSEGHWKKACRHYCWQAWRWLGFLKCLEKGKEGGLINGNGEVNCKVNEFTTESAEAQSLKGYMCISKQHQGMCQALEFNHLDYEIVSTVSSILVAWIKQPSPELGEDLGITTGQGPLPAHSFHVNTCLWKLRKFDCTDMGCSVPVVPIAREWSWALFERQAQMYKCLSHLNVSIKVFANKDR